MIQRFRKVLLPAFLVLTAAVHTALNWQREISRQEAGAVIHSSLLPGSLGGVVRFSAEWDIHPPLYHLMLHLFLTHVSTDLHALRGMSLLLFLPGAAALVWMLSRHVSTAAGGWAAAWIAVGAYPVFLSGFVRPYPLLFTLSAVYALLLVRWAGGVRPGAGACLALVLTVAALLHTQYISVFLILGGTVALGRSRGRAGFLRWIACHAAAGVLFLPWFFRGFLPQILAGRSASYGAIPPHESWLEFARIPFRFFFLGLRGQSVVWMAGTVALLGVLFLLAFRRAAGLLRGRPSGGGPDATGLLAAAWMLGYAGLLACACLGKLLVGMHYFSIFYPAAVVSVAGTLALSRRRRLAACVGVFLVGVGGWTAVHRAASGTEPDEGVRLAALLGDRLAPDDLVLVPDYAESEAAFAYLVWFRQGKRVAILPEENMPYYEGPPDRLPPMKDPVRAAQWLSAELARHRRVWWARTGPPPDALLLESLGRVAPVLEVAEPGNPWTVLRFGR